METVSQSTERKGSLQNTGKYSQATYLVGDAFSKYLKNFYNSIAKCFVTQFKFRNGLCADIFPVITDDRPAAYEMIPNVTSGERKSKV